MILTDFSQIISASILVESDAKECVKHPSEQSKRLVKHFIINSIRYNYAQNKNKYGRMILCCDNNSWRYDVFEEYKYQRKQKRLLDDSGVKWEFVNEIKAELIQDLKMNFPFPVLSVPNCEGDDIIAVITKEISEGSLVNTEEDIFGNVEVEPILILSSDRDNFQLHKYKNVRQYSTIEKKMIRPVVPVKHALLEKIVKGDVGDGVPNIKSSNNALKDKIRQKPISQKYLDEFFASDNPISCCLTEEEKINFQRNEILVSYEKIPKNYQSDILTCYNEQINKTNSKMNLMNYLAQNRMNNLLTQITDFYV